MAFLLYGLHLDRPAHLRLYRRGHGVCSPACLPCRPRAHRGGPGSLGTLLKDCPSRADLLSHGVLHHGHSLSPQAVPGSGSDAADLQFDDHSGRDNPAQPRHGRVLLGGAGRGLSRGPLLALSGGEVRTGTQALFLPISSRSQAVLSAGAAAHAGSVRSGSG